MDELIDIYNDNKEPTGITIPREGAFMKEGQYVLYVTAIVQDLQGRFLITQRSQSKSWAPGWWEVSGGGARAGESSKQAVQREVAEEVGLDVYGIEPELIYSYKNITLEQGANYFMDIYRFRLDFTLQDVVLQEEEAVAGKLATWEEMVALNEQGIFLHFARLQQALTAAGDLA